PDICDVGAIQRTLCLLVFPNDPVLSGMWDHHCEGLRTSLFFASIYHRASAQAPERVVSVAKLAPKIMAEVGPQNSGSEAAVRVAGLDRSPRDCAGARIRDL